MKITFAFFALLFVSACCTTAPETGANQGMVKKQSQAVSLKPSAFEEEYGIPVF